MYNSLNLIFIPLDNRPVSYTLPAQIASLNKNIKTYLPPREFLGGLVKDSDADKIIEWLEKTLAENDIHYIAVSLDTIAYGGLIPSRRSRESFHEIIHGLEKFRRAVEKNRAKIFAFSSIMRISDSYVNEEEKEYWDRFGKEIFRYSYLKHKVSAELPAFPEKYRDELELLEKTIPQEIIEDYKKTRERNFSINRFYLKWIEDGFLDFLAFSKDDTGEYGFNIQETEALNCEIKDKNLSDKVLIQTGADEIPCGLISRIITNHYREKIKIFPVYSTPNGKNIISRYEDKTISENASGQIKLCGADAACSETDADIILLLHTPENVQNDHCLNIHTEPENIEAINFCTEYIKNSKKPVIIADISSANGADNKFVMQILANGVDLNKIYGYAGWNTTGNTLGSVISAGISRFIAEKQNSFNMNNFKKLLLVRLSDDWAYQTVTRQKIRAITDLADKITLKEELIPLVLNISKKIDYDLCISNLRVSFPWSRTFEVEIDLFD